MPPTRYLRLPWPEWGETDHILTTALDALTAALCPCGCGNWRDDTLNAETYGRWQVRIERCQARAAVEAHRKGREPEPGELLDVVLLPEGETAEDLTVFNPATAAEIHARHMERFTTT